LRGGRVRRLRSIDAAAGAAAAIFGVAGCAYALFGPVYRYAGRVVTSNGTAARIEGSASAVRRGPDPATIVYIALVLIAVGGVAVLSSRPAARGRKPAVTPLWGFVASVWILVAVGAASVGLLLLPAALLATVSAALRTRTRA
jgi:hypothetical protein